MKGSLRYFIFIFFFYSYFFGCKTSENQKASSVFFQSQKVKKDSSSLDFIQEKIAKNQIKNEDLSFLFLHADTLFFREKYSEAIELFAKVFELEPSLVVGMKLARCQASAHKFDDAELTLKKTILLFPKNSEPHLALAALAAKSGQTKRLSEILTNAYKIHKDDEDIVLRYSEYLYASGLRERSQHILRDFLKINPSSYMVLLRLAKNKFDEKNYKDAKFFLEKVVQIQPASADAWAILGFIYDYEGQIKTSVKKFREAHVKNPENDLYARSYANQLIKVGDLFEAKRVLMKLEPQETELNALNSEEVFQLGLVLFQLEEFSEAKKRFLKSKSFAKDESLILLLLAQCEEFSGNIDEAYKEYTVLLQHSIHGRKALQRLTFIQLSRGKFAEAEEFLKQYQSYKLTEELDYKFLSNVSMMLKRYEATVRWASEGLRLFPESVDLAYLKLIPLEFLASAERLKDELRGFVKKFPRYPEALNHLGYLLAERNEHLDEALKLLLAAVEQDPKNAHFLDSLGWVYFRRRQYREAEQCLSQASELDPKEPVIWEHLGELAYAQQKWLEALRYFQKSQDVFLAQPTWKQERDADWQASSARVKKRIQQLQERALGS